MKIAASKERSVHFVMRQALNEYIDREQKRIDFYEDGRTALEHYKETGLNVTHEEMMVWAQSLGACLMNCLRPYATNNLFGQSGIAGPYSGCWVYTQDKPNLKGRVILTIAEGIAILKTFPQIPQSRHKMRD